MWAQFPNKALTNDKAFFWRYDRSRGYKCLQFQTTQQKAYCSSQNDFRTIAMARHFRMIWYNCRFSKINTRNRGFQRIARSTSDRFHIMPPDQLRNRRCADHASTGLPMWSQHLIYFPEPYSPTIQYSQALKYLLNDNFDTNTNPMSRRRECCMPSFPFKHIYKV